VRALNHAVEILKEVSPTMRVSKFYETAMLCPAILNALHPVFIEADHSVDSAGPILIAFTNVDTVALHTSCLQRGGQLAAWLSSKQWAFQR
jgi:hypothetical protein